MITGTAKGGHQPVVGAAVSLYAATTHSYGGAPTLLGTATSGTNGFFTITRNSNTCTDPDQLYIVASGGNAGAGSSNAAAVLVAALGTCSSVTTSTNVLIDEASTVAAAYALAGFATVDGSSINISTSTTNATGLTNAFLNAANLVNLHGDIQATTVTGGTVPAALLGSLANSLSACVNSTGISSAGCTPIAVASPAGTTPTNTWQIALQWAKYPASNVAAIYTNSTAQTSNFYTPTLGAQPADVSLAVSYPYSGAAGIAVDSLGDVWLSGISGSPLIELGSNGKLNSPAGGFGTTAFQALTTVSGVAIDTLSSPNVWVASSAGKLYGYNIAGGTLTTLTLPTSYTINSVATTVPTTSTAVAIDNTNDVWYGTTSTTKVSTNVLGEFTLANSAYTSVTTWTGSPVIAGTTANLGAVYMAINPANNEVVASMQQAKPVFFQSPYTTGTTSTGTSAYNASNGVAFSGTAPVIAGGGTATTGNAKINFYSANPATAPSPAVQMGGTAKSTSFNGVATDGAGHVFILTAPLTTTNASSLLEFVSPSTFYIGSNNLGGYTPVDANGSTAYLGSTNLINLAIDQAGVTWIVGPSLLQVLGVAAPTIAPLAAGAGGTLP